MTNYQDMERDELIELLQEHIRKHGAIPQELLDNSKPKTMTKLEYNSWFMTLTTEEQAREINKYKSNRWKMARIPNYIIGEIDINDPKEVQMWKAIDRKRRFPYLGKNEEQKDSMIGTVLFKDRVAHGVQVTNLDISEAPIMGQAVDYQNPRRVWVELLSITDNVWQEVCEV